MSSFTDEVSAQGDSLTAVARVLTMAAIAELHKGLLEEREALIKMARLWLIEGLSGSSDEATEDACARAILEVLGESETAS